MKKTIITNLAILFLILSFNYCSTPNAKLNSPLINDRHPLSVDSLLKLQNPQQAKISQLGKIDNLLLLSGYRGLRLGTSFDSISFEFSGTIDSTYISKGIIIVKKIKSYIDILNTDCGVKLTFYKNKLSVIDIGSWVYTIDLKDYPGVKQHPNYSIDIPFRSLKTMFGNPSVDKSSKIKNNSYKISYTDSINCSWICNNVRLNYLGDYTYYDNTVSQLISHEPINIRVSLIILYSDTEEIIRRNIKIVDDSLKQVSIEQEQQEFIKKF